jgi:hypothetical protein
MDAHSKMRLRPNRQSKVFRQAISDVEERDLVAVATAGDPGGMVWAEVQSVHATPRCFACKAVADADVAGALANGSTFLARPSDVRDIWWLGQPGPAGFSLEHDVTVSSGRLARGQRLVSAVVVHWLRTGPTELRGCVIVPHGVALDAAADQDGDVYRVEIEEGPSATAQLFPADATAGEDGLHMAFIGSIARG